MPQKAEEPAHIATFCGWIPSTKSGIIAGCGGQIKIDVGEDAMEALAQLILKGRDRELVVSIFEKTK